MITDESTDGANEHASPTHDEPAPAASAKDSSALPLPSTERAPSTDDAPGDSSDADDSDGDDEQGGDGLGGDEQGGDEQGGDEQGGDEHGGASESEASVAGEEPTKRKRRRRRRKKKPAEGAEGASGDGAQAAPDGATEGTSEGDPDARGRAARGEQPPRQQALRQKEKRPDRGHGRPPLERPAFNVGDEVFGRVANVTRDAIWIDVAGGKATAFYDRAQLVQVPPKPGETFIATVKSTSTRGGALMLGPEPWDLAQTKNELRAALESQNPIECWVTGIVKGGIEADYKGIRAFAPSSHVDLSHHPDLTMLLGEKLSFVVAQYGKGGRDVVLSRKEMLAKEHTEKRKEQLGGLTAGMRCNAVVRGVVAWGAFATLPEYGDVEGVIHMSEVSHDRGARVSSVLSPGQEIAVDVLRIDDNGKLWLSHKSTIENPWTRAAERYPAGSIHKGKVVRLADFGAFVQLEEGVDALCHVADLAFEPVEHPSKVVNEGDELEFLVVHVDAKNQKIALHPAPPESERDLPRARLAPNQIVKIEVKQIKEAGLGVRIVGATGRSSRGFVPAGQTGTQRGTDLRKTFPLGTKLDAKILEIDPRRGESRLSVRAMKDDEEKRDYRDYQKKVQREATFGTLGDLFKKLER